MRCVSVSVTTDCDDDLVTVGPGIQDKVSSRQPFEISFCSGSNLIDLNKPVEAFAARETKLCLQPVRQNSERINLTSQKHGLACCLAARWLCLGRQRLPKQGGCKRNN